MAVFNTNTLLLAVFAILGIMMSNSNSNMVAGQACQGDLQGLISQCAMFVEKNVPKSNPSPGCCSVIKTVNVTCACEHITKEVEQVVDMDKVVFVAKYCGKALLPGTKCGSYTVPPA